MNIETRQAYSEVNLFLKLIGDDLSNKIPLRLREFFKREMDKNYIPEINMNIPIKEQNLKRKTIAIIAGLNLQYWCKDEEKKKELLNIYSNNEIKYKEQLCEQYKPDSLFKNKKNNIHRKEEISENNTNMIIYNDKNIFIKLVDKIKSFIKNSAIFK